VPTNKVAPTHQKKQATAQQAEAVVDLPRPPTVEELIATVAFYGMAKIPADLLACLEEVAADLAEDDGTGWRVRSAFPYRSMRLAG
jgi:hypothetical protein